MQALERLEDRLARPAVEGNALLHLGRLRAVLEQEDVCARMAGAEYRHALAFLNGLEFPLAGEAAAEAGTIQDWTPTVQVLYVPDIDVFEVYNARLLFEAYNDEALRFARKYNLIMGAGSDAHVLQGVGTGVVRMRSFRDPEEFLISLRSADVLRRPKSLAYLQSLKWMAQVKERVR